VSQFYTERRLTASLSRSSVPFEVILPLFKQKTLAKDISLPFARSLEGLNIQAMYKSLKKSFGIGYF
jgi:hypothetical protein